MITSRFLENFCDSSRERFSSPFLNGDYVVATDTHALVVVNKEEVESDDPLKESEKDYIAIVENGKGDEVRNITFTPQHIVMEKTRKS